MDYKRRSGRYDCIKEKDIMYEYNVKSDILKNNIVSFHIPSNYFKVPTLGLRKEDIDFITKWEEIPEISEYREGSAVFIDDLDVVLQNMTDYLKNLEKEIENIEHQFHDDTYNELYKNPKLRKKVLEMIQDIERREYKSPTKIGDRASTTVLKSIKKWWNENE